MFVNVRENASGEDWVLNIRRCLHEQETVIFFILCQMSKKIGYFWLSESYLELSNLLRNLFFTPLKAILASLTVRNNSSQGFPIFNIALICLWSKCFIYFILYIFHYDALLFPKITHKQNRKLLGTNPVNQCAKFHPYWDPFPFPIMLTWRWHTKWIWADDVFR